MEVISVLEVVDSVAKQVPTPEGWRDGILNRAEIPILLLADQHPSKSRLSERIHGMKGDFLNGLFLTAYRDSQAAGALDYYFDRVGEDALQWLDWGQTGWPKVSATARSEGLAMLVHMSRYFERYSKAYQAGRFDGWPRVSDVQSSEGKFEKRNDAQRLTEIGFERAKAIDFLNRHEIPHSLGNSLPAPGREQRDMSDGNPSVLIEDSDIAAHRRDISDSSDQEGNSQPVDGRRVHHINGRHILANLIDQARTQAGEDRNDARIVYGFLVLMAKSGNYPPTLIGFEPRRGVKYLSGTDEKFYTKEALRKYMNPEARGRKKSPSADGTEI